MGKFNNQAVWNKHQPRSEDQRERPLTEAEWEEGYSEWKWDKDDATADELDRARWAYSLPVVRVRLFDEMGVGR